MTTKAAILQAIRLKCLDCSCHQPSEVRECTVTACELWPFRFGSDPDPSQTRGFAKQSVHTGGLLPAPSGEHRDTGGVKSPVYTHGSEQHRPIQRTAPAKS